MNTKPTALLLAEKLEQQFPLGTAQHYLDGEAAAELRRLHAEAEELRGALDEAMWHVKYKELKAVNESDTALLRQALEALEQFSGTKLVRTSNIITALRERLGEKT